MLKNLNTKYFVYILLVISFITWCTLALFSRIDRLELMALIKMLPQVAFVDLVLVGLFVKWGWRTRYFRKWLVPFPDLNGTWQGTIQTSWKDPEKNEPLAPIPALLTIRQTFTHISCVMRTAEMTSYSFAEDFKLDENRQIRQLVYTYSSKPLLLVSDRSPQHDGSVVLDIIGNPASKLRGQYWTARGTTGELSFTFREKGLLDEIPNDFEGHPMSRDS